MTGCYRTPVQGNVVDFFEIGLVEVVDGAMASFEGLEVDIIVGIRQNKGQSRRVVVN